MKSTNPDYKTIFLDILHKKFPNKLEGCLKILAKESITTIDVIKLNNFIFDKRNSNYNQKYKSYTKNDIFQILSYQKKHNLNNIELAGHFKISRNTVSKWKKQFSNYSKQELAH